MVLYNSNLLTLDYDPTTDILSLNWPDVLELFVPALQQEINELINTVKHYDIKKLLIDTSKALVNLETGQYQEFLVAFCLELKSTRLQKLARIGTSDPIREKLAEDTREAISSPGSFEFQLFQNKSEAMDWLME